VTLTCCYCGGPIVKSRTPAHTEEVLVQGHSQIERAWHRTCEPLAIPPDSPFQAAVQKAKQSIEDARRLGPDAFQDFVAIVRLALTEQR
jgi:hypothetical protein